MATRTVTTYICDCCGAESSSNSFSNESSYGYTKITYEGQRGGKNWEGTWAGVTHSGKLHICDKCTGDFMRFTKNHGVNDDGKQ